MPDLIKAAKSVGRFVWEYLIPHAVTEDVALAYVGDNWPADRSEWGAYELVCCMSDVETGESFDAIGEVDSITWLGIGIAYRVGNFRPWPWEVIHG